MRNTLLALALLAGLFGPSQPASAQFSISIGLPNVRILNGGFAAFLATGGAARCAFSMPPTAATPQSQSQKRVPLPKSALLAGIAEVLAASRGGGVVVRRKVLRPTMAESAEAGVRKPAAAKHCAAGREDQRSRRRADGGSSGEPNRMRQPG